MRCEVANASVYYEEYGEGRPLLLLHGVPGEHQHLEDFMEPLFAHRSGWRRIYPDLPGAGGQTPGPDWMTNSGEIIDLIEAFVDAVISGERFVVAGFSFGGAMARRVAQRRRDWLDGVCLVAPGAGGSKPPRQLLVQDAAFEAAMDTLIAQYGSEAEEWKDMAVVQSPALAAVAEADLPAVVRADHAFLDRIFNSPSTSPESSPDYVDKPFPAPVLIVTGRQDHVLGYQGAWDLLDVYPRASFAVLDRAGHVVFVEQKALVTALVNEWLDRVEEYVTSSAFAVFTSAVKAH